MNPTTTHPSRDRVNRSVLRVNRLARSGGILAIALGLFSIGCSSSSFTSSDLIAGEHQPLSQVGLADVESASSSCEGMLATVDEFALLGETGLLVGLDDTGDAVCIDTVDAVNAELGEVGRLGDASALVARYEFTMATRASMPRNQARTESTQGSSLRRDVRAGDPDPEPNHPQQNYSQQGTRAGI